MSEAELFKALKQAKAMFAYSAESITNQAFWLGYTEIFNTAQWFENYLSRLAEVTVADVQRVAQTYLRSSNRTVGYFIPENPAG